MMFNLPLPCTDMEWCRLWRLLVVTSYTAMDWNRNGFFFQTNNKTILNYVDKVFQKMFVLFQFPNSPHIFSEEFFLFWWSGSYSGELRLRDGAVRRGAPAVHGGADVPEARAVVVPQHGFDVHRLLHLLQVRRHVFLTYQMVDAILAQAGVNRCRQNCKIKRRRSLVCMLWKDRNKFCLWNSIIMHESCSAF